jgi:tRNA pseudouridine38-40 synthase
MPIDDQRKASILISYDGTPFYGWQRQKNRITVQQSIEDVLETLFQKKTTVHGAGRTDAGVHAAGQTAHFEVPRNFNLNKLSHSMNSMLRPEIRIISCVEVTQDFHARFSATSKTYFYIINTSKLVSPFLRNYCCHLPDIGDLSRLEDALHLLVGEHNFERFTAADAVCESPIRKISAARLIKAGDFIFISFTADGFLRYLVRTLTGTLIKISQNKFSISDFEASLKGEMTKPLPCTLKMEPNGLYLHKVNYDTNPFAGADSQGSQKGQLWPFIKEIDLCRLSD